MKKIITALAVSAALTLTAGLTACSEKAEGGKFDEFKTTESVYGFSAASAGMIISSLGAEKANAEAGGAQPFAAAVSADYDTSVLDRYMSLVESLLSDGSFSITSPKSDRAEYTDKTVVSYPDLSGKVTQYVMYYNKTLTDYENEDDGEIEEKYSISGVMVIDGADYEIYGKTKTETDGAEREAKTQFRVTLGENRYMLVEHETESESDEFEQEYGYSVYEDGKVLEKSSFSYETEKGETELKMTSVKNGIKETFRFEKERKNGKDVISIRVGDGELKAKYTVRVNYSADGEKSYSYIPD